MFGYEFERFVGVLFLLGHRFKQIVLKLESEILIVVFLKKRRSDDSEFCKTENESRLERFNKDCEDSDFLAKHNENQLRDITKRLKDPEKRAEHNKQQLDTMTERLKDPDVRAQHNSAGLRD